MSWLTALLLAVLQGLTEFLPVSSSGHLVLLQNVLERRDGHPLPEALLFDVLVHTGTLMAVLIYFRKDLLSMATGVLTGPAGDSHNGRRELGLIAVSLVPTALLGLGLKNTVESLLQRPVLVSGLIGVTGFVLLATRRTQSRSSMTTVHFGWTQALAMGAAQGLAVLPGLSRSGLTIAAGLALGLKPAVAFRWSFLLSIPAVAGATILEVGLAPEGLGRLGAPVFVAAAVAMVVGLFALRLLARSLHSARFHQFSWYCFGVALAGMVLFSLWV